jgi:AraC family transcriptional regulator
LASFPKPLPSSSDDHQELTAMAGEADASAAIRPRDLSKILTFQPAAESGLEWVGLYAARFHTAPAFELNEIVLTHHMLALFARPPEELDLLYHGVERHVPPPAGSIILIPAGSPVRARSSGYRDELHVFLEPGFVGRVAAEAFELDSALLALAPLDGLNLPHLRAAMLAEDAEMTASGAGGRLAAESLATLMAVQLIRLALAPAQPECGRDGPLSRAKLRDVVEYIEEHLDTRLTLEQMAAAAHLSAYHFARQFKAATGMAPHQSVIARRVARGQQFLQSELDLSLAEIAARTGFSDQSQFSHHFKRLIGVTPRQFRISTRIA